MPEELRYYEIGTTDEFPVRLGKVVHIGEHDIAVFRTTEGKLFALENKSPGPRGGTLAEGIVSGEVLYDPICDWKISLANGHVLAPDTGQVRCYPVRHEGKLVSIGISDQKA